MKHDAQFKHQTSVSFMEERGERVRLGGWTNTEHCLFVQALKHVHVEDATESVTTSALHYVYNSLVDFIERNATLGGIILNAKSEEEVGAKYAQHCKEAALLNSFLSSNNGNLITIDIALCEYYEPNSIPMMSSTSTEESFAP